MDEPPTDKRTSTPVATKAIQATAVYQGRLICSIDLETWKHVDREKLLEMICDNLQSKSYKQDPVPQPQSGVCSMEVDHEGESKDENVGDRLNTKTTSTLRDKLRTLLRLKQQKRKGSRRPLRLEHLVYLVDIGGQVQFQEVVPLFVRNASVNVLILKLSTELDSKAKNEYFIDGNEVAEPEHMVLTVKDFIVNTTRSIFSQKPKLDIEQVVEAPEEPKVVLIGTFADQESSCSESRKEKEHILRTHGTFRKHIKQDHFITCDRKKLILDIDGSEAGHQNEVNKKKLKLLRQAILTQASKLKVKVPLAWYLLLLDIQAESDEHDFLTLQRCYELGEEWNIATVGVDAALRYFDELNLILYFPSTCPGVVFCNPQFLLKKVTDMIVASFPALAPDVDFMSGSREIFRAEGIFSHELFKLPEYLYGFNDKFTQRHLLHLMQDLLIIAKVSQDSKGNEQFFMPCVLEQEQNGATFSALNQNVLSVEPLIVTFSHECSPRGLFCATIVSLIQAHQKRTSKFQWVITSSDKLVRKRNKIEFELYKLPAVDSKFDSKVGTVTLQDNSISFMISTTCDKTECSDICDDLETSIDDAIDKLSYENYKFGFVCPQCKIKHPAFVTVADGYCWKCDIKNVKRDLTDAQQPWFSQRIGNLNIDWHTRSRGGDLCL